MPTFEEIFGDQPIGDADHVAREESMYSRLSSSQKVVYNELTLNERKFYNRPAFHKDPWVAGPGMVPYGMTTEQKEEYLQRLHRGARSQYQRKIERMNNAWGEAGKCGAMVAGETILDTFVIPATVAAGTGCAAATGGLCAAGALAADAAVFAVEDEFDGPIWDCLIDNIGVLWSEDASCEEGREYLTGTGGTSGHPCNLCTPIYGARNQYTDEEISKDEDPSPMHLHTSGKFDNIYCEDEKKSFYTRQVPDKICELTSKSDGVTYKYPVMGEGYCPTFTTDDEAEGDAFALGAAILPLGVADAAAEVAGSFTDISARIVPNQAIKDSQSSELGIKDPTCSGTPESGDGECTWDDTNKTCPSGCEQVNPVCSGTPSDPSDGECEWDASKGKCPEGCKYEISPENQKWWSEAGTRILGAISWDADKIALLWNQDDIKQNFQDSDFGSTNPCDSDKFRMAGSEATRDETFNRDTSISNYCCPKPIGSEKCPYFVNTDLESGDTLGTNWSKANQYTTQACYNRISGRKSFGGIDCGKKDGSNPVKRVTHGDKTFLDVVRPDDGSSSDGSSREGHIYHTFELNDQSGLDSKAYFGTKFTLDVDTPYDTKIQDRATGRQHYQGPEENAGGVCKDSNEDIVQLSGDSSTKESQCTGGNSWTPSQSYFDPSGDYYSNYNELIHKNVGCEDPSQCTPLETTQFMQSVYDREFCMYFKTPDSVFPRGLKKFYRPSGYFEGNHQNNLIPGVDEEPNRITIPDLCCPNIEGAEQTAFIGCDAMGENPYFIDDIFRNSPLETTTDESLMSTGTPPLNLNQCVQGRSPYCLNPSDYGDDICRTKTIESPYSTWSPAWREYCENDSIGGKCTINGSDENNVDSEEDCISQSGHWTGGHCEMRASKGLVPHKNISENDGWNRIPTQDDKFHKYADGLDYRSYSYTDCILPEDKLNIFNIEIYNKLFDWYVPDNYQRPSSSDSDPSCEINEDFSQEKLRYHRRVGEGDPLPPHHDTVDELINDHTHFKIQCLPGYALKIGPVIEPEDACPLSIQDPDLPENINLQNCVRQGYRTEGDFSYLYPVRCVSCDCPDTNCAEANEESQPIPCQGVWEPETCDESCTQTFRITREAQNGGTPCSNAAGDQRPCASGEGGCVTPPSDTGGDDGNDGNDGNEDEHEDEHEDDDSDWGLTDFGFLVGGVFFFFLGIYLWGKGKETEGNWGVIMQTASAFCIGFSWVPLAAFRYWKNEQNEE